MVIDDILRQVQTPNVVGGAILALLIPDVPLVDKSRKNNLTWLALRKKDRQETDRGKKMILV